MSFIQVCPQYAKTVFFYEMQFSKLVFVRDVPTDCPFQKISDADNGKSTSTFDFPKRGDYRVTITVLFNGKTDCDFRYYSSSDEDLNKFDIISEEEEQDFADQRGIRNTAILHCFQPVSGVMLKFVTSETRSVVNASVVIEYLH